MDRNDYIRKWLENSLNEAEKRAFEKTEDYRFLKRLDDSLTQFKAPDYDVQQEAERLLAGQEKAKVRRIWSSGFVKIAASVVIAFALAVVYFTTIKSDEMTVIAAEKSELFLPDSSFVRLNAGSTITYKSEDWRENRRVDLEGEAFFQVAHGSKFDVVTPSGMVSVLGTQFNVKSRASYFEVSCYEGKVQVATQKNKLTLQKNESWRMLGRTAQAIPLQTTSQPDWLEGESRFKSVPFKYVVEEFERQYKVKVKLENIDKQQLFTGSFAHDNINLALKSISLPLNLSYKLGKDQVLLYGAQ